MERLEADFLLFDLVIHGAPIEYTLKRLTGIDIKCSKS